jgi:coniferyl-aldehyde dehydrogenase
MSAILQDHDDHALANHLQGLLSAQRKAFSDELPVSAATRIERINRAIALLVDHQDSLCEAMAADFGHRPANMSRLVDISSSVGHMKHARKHLKTWMKREKRPVRFPLNLLGAKAWIEYQPLGVVGIVSPWNYPVAMGFAPMASALAAGNRCMLKPSEFTAETSELTARLIAEYFDETEITVVTGGPEVGQAFTAQPFDHLLFTGATAIAPHILRAAAPNLTPVTLELGGKSPTIIGRGADLDDTASKIMVGKMMNSGQTCLAPDYLFVPESDKDRLLEKIKACYQRMYPQANNSPDYTAIINQRHADRLSDYLAEARDKGAEVLAFDDESASERRMPLTVIINPDEDLALMQNEIFGPILPLKTYTSIDEVIEYINANPRPLGLYYFGSDNDEQRQVLDRTIAGGVTLNDVLFHITVDDLPFGGVGQSGMGAYHGIEGFKSFSHAKAVYQQAKVNVAKIAGLIPPYGKALEATLRRELKK